MWLMIIPNVLMMISGWANQPIPQLDRKISVENSGAQGMSTGKRIFHSFIASFY